MDIEFKSLATQAEGRNELSYRQLLTYLKNTWVGLEWPKPDVVYLSATESAAGWADAILGTNIANCFAGWSLYNEHSQQLWGTLLDKQDVVQLATTDDIINFGYVDFYSRHEIEQVLTCWHGASFNPETELELQVTKRFKEVPEVQSIYTNKYLNGKIFFIMTLNEKYNDALTDQLLLIERELHLSHFEIDASFVYIPKLLESADEVVPRESKLVYERGYDVIFVGPLMASRTEREASQAAAW